MVCIACCNAFSHLCCKKLEMPWKANPMNPLIKANIICLFWHFGCTFVSLSSNLGKMSPISFSKILYMVFS